MNAITITRAPSRTCRTYNLQFEKTPDSLRVTYWWFRDQFQAQMEIVRVGSRFALVRNGKFEATVDGRGLLAALSDFRWRAGTAAHERRQWRAEYE